MDSEVPKMEKPKPKIYLSDGDAEKFDHMDLDEDGVVTARVKVVHKSKSVHKHDGKKKEHHSLELELSDIKMEKDLEKKLEGKEF